MGGGEGGINGKNKIEEKIPEGNNFNIPLKPNLNSKMVEFGKLCDSRKACWLGKGLTVNVNEYGKRRVSWDGVKGKWVTANNARNTKVGLGLSKQNAQALLENKEPILGLGLSSPQNFEVGKSSFSGPRALESSYLNGFTMLSSSRSELTAMMDFTSSMVTPITSELPVMSTKVSSSLTVIEVAGKGG